MAHINLTHTYFNTETGEISVVTQDNVPAEAVRTDGDGYAHPFFVLTTVELVEAD